MIVSSYPRSPRTSFPSSCHFSLSSFPATLTNSSQLHDNTTTLSPAVATLAGRVRLKSFACHSCKKHPGWGSVEQTLACSPFPQLVALDPEAPSFATSMQIVLPPSSFPALAPFVSALESTPTRYPAGVDSRPLTGSLKALDATLTRNRGEGSLDKKSMTLVPVHSTKRLTSYQILHQGIHSLAQGLVRGSRITSHGSPSPGATRCLEGHAHRQYNPMFACPGGISHGYGRSENPCV